eukprot:4301348-Pyramimonas_sp.AAC.1
MVLYELRLYHGPLQHSMSLRLMPSCNMSLDKGWPLEQVFGVERYRDKEREAATDQVRKAQS